MTRTEEVRVDMIKQKENIWEGISHSTQTMTCNLGKWIMQPDLREKVEDRESSLENPEWTKEVTKSLKKFMEWSMTFALLRLVKNSQKTHIMCQLFKIRF